MLYTAVRPIVKAGFYAYFRKIYLLNTDRIPRDKPVILASNHPTGFMEPCIAACFLDRPLYFLVRGDFFAKPLYASLLRALHMLPVYRLKDGGYRKLKNNFATFEACHNALREHRAIMIYIEGSTEYVKRLRPLQKGAARIAFGGLERFPDMEDVYIVPMGVTYEAAHQWRSCVMLDCGEPVRARDFLEQYQVNANEAISSLTDAVGARLKQCMVHIDDPENDELVEWLLRMDNNDHPEPVLPAVSRKEEPLERAQAIAEGVNALDEEQRNRLKRDLATHFAELEERNLLDRDLGPIPRLHVVHYLFLLIGALPAALGYLVHQPPLAFAKKIADSQVKSIEFYGPVKYVAGLGLSLVYFLLLLLIAGGIWGWAGVLAVLGLLLLGYFAVWYGEWLQIWRSRQRSAALSEEERGKLRARRERILDWIKGRVRVE